MDAWNVKHAVEQALLLMEQSNFAAKTVKVNRTAGFGAVVRHFERKGVADVTAELLDTFVVEQRACFESGMFSEWKWRCVRRGVELLKQFAESGGIEMGALPPWEPVLRKPRQRIEKDIPTPEQLADPSCLFALIWRTKQELQRLGLARDISRHYTQEAMEVILRKHVALGLECYSEPVAAELVTEVRERYENKQVSRGTYQNLRKAHALLSQVYHTGTISPAVLPNWGQREPLPAFAQALERFCDDAISTGAMAVSSTKTAKSAARSLIFELEARGFTSLENITLSDMSRSVTHIARRYTGGLHSVISSVRAFLRYLYECGFTSENLSSAVPEMVARRTIFREGFSQEETERLLAYPDTSESIGKRDYAIMVLAAQTGLRACDIVALRREDIEWHTNEIRIVQRKTGKPLSLPLAPESGNAIADYLLHGRPESELPYIFLCHTGVKRPINNRSASAMVTKYLRRAGIVSATPRRGFHSFRRSFGTKLLQSEVPLDLLRQLLGHSTMDSAKPYLSVDEQNLKNCALDLSSIEKAGEGI